ncbi:drug resistance transporter, Bcr/CflA subfamily [Salinihabitans flavidus]|uniref:Bcr/CflA family efflux transporter n=1 Tax=Salinihabitans flavidus TaxID=569882 RepID=A0A1H8TCC1_9RHOB|nr:multidrug effflux MFS transporter [Salinihabitans flavidus]SEO88779.1 drug resistance transporter, Bcr/CflA subfamily [Salinihabitans flavidus]
MQAARTPPRLVTLVLVTAVSVLTLNMFLPSLSGMAEDFGVEYALINLSIAGYLVMAGVLQVIIGSVSDRYGRRPVMLWGMGIFALASLGCVLASDVRVFLICRMVQSAVIAGPVLARAAIRDMVGEREAASLMGYVAMAMAIAPMMGPMVGGAMDVLFGWRASFLFYAVAGGALVILVWADMGETHHARSASFGAQFRAYPELLRSRRFWGYALCYVFSVGAFYAFLAGAPLVASTAFGLSPAVLGIGMGSITGGFFVGNFITGRLARFHAPARMMVAGRLVACGGLAAGLLLYMAGVVHPVAFFAPVVCVGLGNGLTVPGANAGAMSVRPALAGSASGLSGAMTVAGGAAFSTLAGTVLTPGNGIWLLLAIMLGSAGAGLVSALYVAWIDRREGAL